MSHIKEGVKLINSEKEMKIVKKPNAKDYAYVEIKQRIIEGVLLPDQQVSEEELCSKLDISRTPLRGALERLELEKLVVRQVNGRMKIAPISVKEVKEIFKVRSVLEGLAVSQATENVTEKDIKHLSELVKKIRENLEDNNVEQILHFGNEFHSHIYNLANNETVTDFLSQLYDRIYRYRRLVPNDSRERLIREEEEHQKILNCIIRGDKRAAELAMKEHIQNSLETAIKAIEIYEQRQKDFMW